LNSWPDPGCCAYRDTLDAEREILSRTREPVNIGLLTTPIPFSACQVIEVATGKSNILVENKTINENLTVIFFWTKWYF
jgi:hypothetical protein